MSGCVCDPVVDIRDSKPDLQEDTLAKSYGLLLPALRVNMMGNAQGTQQTSDSPKAK